MKISNIFDVSKGNNVLLFIISVPFIILAYIIFGLFYVVASLAMTIGRRRALNALYPLKDIV